MIKAMPPFNMQNMHNTHKKGWGFDHMVTKAILTFLTFRMPLGNTWLVWGLEAKQAWSCSTGMEGPWENANMIGLIGKLNNSWKKEWQTISVLLLWKWVAYWWNHQGWSFSFLVLKTSCLEQQSSIGEGNDEQKWQNGIIILWHQNQVYPFCTF